jgi:hypothetical protein
MNARPRGMREPSRRGMGILSVPPASRLAAPRRLRAMALAASMMLSAAAGCCKPCPTDYLSRGQLVAVHNANAANAPRLWARAAVQVHLVDARGRAVDWGSTLLAPNALLFLDKAAGDRAVGASGPTGPDAPEDFVLIGSESGQEIFRLGVSASDRVYYIWTSVGSQAWGMFGHTALAGAPGGGAIPVNPLDLSSVLGLTPLPADFARIPNVQMRLHDQPCECAYVLTLLDRQPVTGAIVARRDVYMDWDANRPPRPFRVDLLDDAGRAVMIARLKNYKPVAIVGEDAPAGPPAVMPSDIEITWPKAGSRIHMVLSEMKTRKIDPDAFLFRDRMPPGVRDNLTCTDPQTTTAPTGR